MEELNQVREIFFVFTISLARIMACFVIFPLMGKKLLGGTLVRNGIIGSLILYVYPSVAAEALGKDLSSIMTGLLVLKEAMVGLMIGFCSAIPFWAIESCGFFIDNQRGATLASNVNPALESESSPFGILLSQVLIVIFLVTGAFFVFLRALFTSYTHWPPMSFFPNFNAYGAEFFLNQLNTCMRICVLSASPVVISMFLSEFGLALVSRFAPAMNVFFLSLPIKSGVAMFILVVYVGILLHFYKNELFAIPDIFNQLHAIWQP